MFAIPLSMQFIFASGLAVYLLLTAHFFGSGLEAYLALRPLSLPQG